MSSADISRKAQKAVIHATVLKSVHFLFGGKKRYDRDIKASADEVGLIEELAKCFSPGCRGRLHTRAQGLIMATIETLPDFDEILTHIGHGKQTRFMLRTADKVRKIVNRYEEARGTGKYYQ